jgi:hypothetical protein
MPERLSEKYGCLFDPTPAAGRPRVRAFFAPRRPEERPDGDAYAYAIQCSREVWKAMDNNDPRRWLISTDNDTRSSVRTMGYQYRVYDKDRCKHKMWAKVTGVGTQRMISFYGLDDELQDTRPQMIAPTFSLPAPLRGYANEQVTRFIEATAYRGSRDRIHGAKFTLGDTNNVQHRTQKASNNTIFYVWELENMRVVGIGNHTRSNTEYEYFNEAGQKRSHSF